MVFLWTAFYWPQQCSKQFALSTSRFTYHGYSGWFYDKQSLPYSISSSYLDKVSKWSWIQDVARMASYILDPRRLGSILIQMKTMANFVVYNGYVNLDDVVNDVTTSDVTQNEYLWMLWIFLLAIFYVSLKSMECSVWKTNINFWNIIKSAVL